MKGENNLYKRVIQLLRIPVTDLHLLKIVFDIFSPSKFPADIYNVERLMV